MSQRRVLLELEREMTPAVRAFVEALVARVAFQRLLDFPSPALGLRVDAVIDDIVELSLCVISETE